jgi:hypothetical protein
MKMKKCCLRKGQTNKYFGKMIISFIWIVFYLSVSSAQNQNNFGYLQLNLGDKYDYYRIKYPPDYFSNFTDSIQLGDYEFSSFINDTVRIDGKKYFIITNFIWDAKGDTIRIDTEGNLLFRFHGVETMLFKFSGKENETWEIGSINFGLDSKGNILKLPIATMSNCLKFIVGASKYPIYYFAPLFGRVVLCNNKGNIALGKAVINGIEYRGVTSIKKNIDNINSKNFKLFPCYPNPFNPETVIRFELSKCGMIIIYIYNVTGKMVREISNYYYSPGKYEVKWDGRDNNGNRLSTGVYIYHIGNYGISEKMLLIK